MNSNPIKTTKDYSGLIEEAKALVQSVPDWPKGKIFQHWFQHHNLDIHTSIKEINNDTWYSRSNVINKKLTAKYKNQFFKYLIGEVNLTENHSTHEAKYIHECTKYEIKPFDESSYLLKTYYKLQFPFKTRVFYDWVHIIRESEDEGYVISFSLDPKEFESTTDTSHVIGRYTSIEHIKVIDGEIHWTMCTASTPAGALPHFLVKMTIPSAISRDVPSFLKYVENLN